MKGKRYSYIPIAVLVVAYVCMGVFLFSYRNYPLDDDWSYLKAAETYHYTGDIKFTPWTAMSLVFQIWWGTGFTKLFGYSIAVLRLSTLVISLAGLVFVYLLLCEMGYAWQNSFMAALVILVNPFSFPLNFTFFTDHFFLSLLFIAAYCYYRAFRDDSDALLVIASLVTCASVLVRQNGMLVVAGVFIYLLLRERSLVRLVRRGMVILLLPAITLLIFNYWFSAVHGPTAEYVRQIGEIVNNLRKPHLLIAKSIWRPFLILEFLGFCLLPLSFSLLPSLKGLSGRKDYFPLLLFCLTGILCYLLYDHIGLFPTSVDLWLNGFRFAFVSEYGYRDSFHIMFFFYKILDFLSMASIVYLFYLLITHWSEVRRSFSPSSPSLLLMVVALLQVVFLIIALYKFSRYYLVLIPFCIMLILEATRFLAINRKIFACLIACYALFSLAVTQDMLSWNQCKWQLAQRLLDKGIEPRKISAGFAWDAWHNCQYSLDHPYEIVTRKGDFPWWMETLTPAVDPCYIISNSPVPTGFEILSYFDMDRYTLSESADYLSRFHLKKMKVYVLERLPAVELHAGGTVAISFLQDLKGALVRGVPPGEVKQLSVEMGGIEKQCWLQPSASGVLFRIRLPYGRCRLSAALGMMPSCWDGEGDGVLYKITINDSLFENVFTAPGEASTAQMKNFLRPRTIFLMPRTYFMSFIDPKRNPSERAWQDISLDLSRFAGKVVDIAFEVSGGPRDDNRSDEALWGSPVIEEY